MSGSFVPTALRGLACLPCLFALWCTGCRSNDEPIRSFDEPRPDYDLPLLETSSPERMSIWGIIAPAGNGQWWFFKLVGPTELVRAEKKQFDSFAKSLEYHPKAEYPWEWKLPKSWRRMEGDGTRIYTFELGPDMREREDAIAFVGGPSAARLIAERAYPFIYPEMSVTLLGGSLVSNVNRWREQVGLKPLELAEMQRSLKLLSVEGAALFVVELNGPVYNIRPRMQMPHGGKAR